jgi:lysophospholipase L1-like esterase
MTKPRILLFLIIPVFFLIWNSLVKEEFRIDKIILQKMSKSIADPSFFSFTYTIAIPEQKDSIVHNTRPQRIFFFGDSMVWALSLRMVQYAAENGHELLNLVWVSSTTKSYAKHKDTLAHFIRKFQPTYIIICLGSNELTVRNSKVVDAHIKTILKTIDTIPFIWIGPPNWKEDEGINDFIENGVGKDRFFPSKRLDFRRANDGIHPTYASAAMWLDSVAHWMRDSTQYRFAMELPSSKKGRGETIRLKPLKRL